MHRTIHVPDDLARTLEGIAAAQKKSVEQVAVERLQRAVDAQHAAGSPEAVLRAMEQPPHVGADAVEELNAAIAAGRMPARESDVFRTEL